MTNSKIPVDLVDLVLHAEHLHGLPQLLLLVRAELLLLLSSLSTSFFLLSPLACNIIYWDDWIISSKVSPFFPFFPP